jgi:hypothetical protein
MSARHEPTLDRNPFLLPLCHCGGTTNLSRAEPHPGDETQELRIYLCTACGSARTYVVAKDSGSRSL